jgi:cellulose synthase/poly-beta-1,6-N-acetylglucosamine synthase-like glycosyltransferase
MMWVFYAAIPFAVFYVSLITIYHIGWLKIKPFKSKAVQDKLTFSVIIPSRNEEQNIAACMHDVIKQHYPEHKFEIIVVNDHSVDQTQQIVENVMAKSELNNMRLINMHEKGEDVYLKKSAITHAIAEAKHQYIILTDADCTRGDMWLETINSFLHTYKSKMIYAPVEFKANNVFEKMQAIEFAGLVAIGGAAIHLKHPNMCSAANLIFEKTLFNEIGGYDGDDGIASGDDEFLLHKSFKLYPNRIHFLKGRNAIVKTRANVSLTQLTDQRRRWVSKSTKYENHWITITLACAYLFNALVVVNLIVNFKLGLLLLAIKTLTEGLFLFNVMHFFKAKKYLFLLPLAEIFHIIYVLVIGIWANVGTYNWKGRNVR